MITSKDLHVFIARHANNIKAHVKATTGLNIRGIKGEGRPKYGDYIFQATINDCTYTRTVTEDYISSETCVGSDFSRLLSDIYIRMASQYKEIEDIPTSYVSWPPLGSLRGGTHSESGF